MINKAELISPNGRHDAEGGQEVILPLVAFVVGVNAIAFLTPSGEEARMVAETVDILAGVGVIGWAFRKLCTI